MKIGIAQINTTVGDLGGNSEKIIAAYDALCKQGAEIVVFPELTICGYSPGDLIFKSRFVINNELVMEGVAKKIGKVPALIGYINSTVDKETGKRLLHNAGAWCLNGEINAVARKCLLPSYNVFNEKRYFQAAEAPISVEYAGRRIGIAICEDIWNPSEIPSESYYKIDPIAELAKQDVDLVLNISASPWHYKKRPVRKQVLASVAERCKAPFVYCNLVGGNDAIVFDGHSQVLKADGTRIAGLNGFQEELKVIDTEAEEAYIADNFDQDPMADIYDALTLGIRDYAYKTGFEKAVIGLSGGLDSAVMAVLAVDVFGADNVIGVRLPSKYSSQHSLDDAEALAKNLGIKQLHTLPIKGIVSDIEKSLEPVFEGLPRDVTEENIQARTRGLLLMALSNKFHAILLSTGNKSEMAVGYCTLYGDMAGGLAALSDVLKTKVYKLAEYINREREIIPSNTISKEPSAELSDNQIDSDSLPTYNILDDIIEKYVVEGKSSAEIIETGHDEAVVRDIISKIDRNEYKRKQAPPGIKITPMAFGAGRCIPIVQKYVS